MHAFNSFRGKSQLTMRDRLIRFGLVLAAMLALSSARAETVFLESRPSSKLSTQEAARAMVKGTAYKCEKVKLGANVNPRKVKGDTATWHSAVGKGLDEPFEALASGKALYKCQQMQGNPSTGRAMRVEE